MTTNSTSDHSIAFFQRLQQLKLESGPNKHDQVDNLIIACIEEGRDTAKQIFGVLQTLGFNNKHVAKRLKDGTGPNPKRHLWHADAEDRYVLHEESSEG